jgi:hypothetical protein
VGVKDEDLNYYGDGPITTGYGNDVSVYPSSAASRPCAWLRVEPSPHLDLSVAHIDRAMAVKVRDALDEFIHEDEEEAPKSLLPCNSTQFCASHGYCWRCDPAQYTERWAQGGLDTPACDCGHKGMGCEWHAKDCEWIASLRTRTDVILREKCQAEIVKALRALVPKENLGRIWGRRSGTSQQDGWEANLWAMDPEDLAQMVVKILDPWLRLEDR